MGRFGRNVLLLSATSFLADVSGEMLMAVLPFLLVAQGASGVGLGLTGGMADAVGHVLKPVFGGLSDRMRRRKPLVAGGYLLAALSRIGIALAGHWFVTLAFRSADRVGKGMRSAPRDALLAESAGRAERGRAFGLQRAADTAGAVVGVAVALAALVWLGASASSIVLAGAIVGLATLVPVAFVRDEARSAADEKRLLEPASPRYRAFLVVAGIFALGNVSYLFFVLRAAQATGGAAGAVALYLVFNVVYATASYPAGSLADRHGKPLVLLAGFLLFGASALLFLLPPTLPLALAGFVVLGLAFAGTESVERAFAADLAGSAARGTRLGLFQGVVGVATLVGGLAAGVLWDQVAAWATFAYGAALALLAAMLLVALGFVRGRDSSHDDTAA